MQNFAIIIKTAAINVGKAFGTAYGCNWIENPSKIQYFESSTIKLVFAIHLQIYNQVGESILISDIAAV